MKKTLSFMLSLALLVLCFCSLGASAYAYAPSVNEIPVTVELSGTLPSKAEDFTIILQAADSSCPMPEGAKDDVYSMTITGANTRKLPAISYDKVGIYNYTISQAKGSTAKLTYDETKYTLTVQVTNKQDGSDELAVTAIVFPEDSTKKVDGVKFTNVYPTVTPTPAPTATANPNAPKTGDESNVALYAALALISLAALAVAVKRLTKKQ